MVPLAVRLSLRKRMLFARPPFIFGTSSFYGNPRRFTRRSAVVEEKRALAAAFLPPKLMTTAAR